MTAADDAPGDGRHARASQRVPLHRAVAVITAESIAIRAPRGGLSGPLVQGLLAGGAVWVIAGYMDRVALWALGVLLVIAVILGPIAVLGLVYNVAGSSFIMERRKQSARWQQGFLGLGLGTYELVPFWRIARIEAVSDAADRLSGGDVQDVIRWDVRLVKDNGRAITAGTVIAARPLAEEGVRRVNLLAAALAEMAGVAVQLVDGPGSASNEDPDRLTRRYRRVD